MVSVSSQAQLVCESCLKKKERKKERKKKDSFHCGAGETNPTRNHEVAGSIPGPTQSLAPLSGLRIWH